MRIIHEIITPMQVGGGGRPYINRPGKQGFNGSQVELCIVTSPPGNHPELPEGMFGPEWNREAIYIEGNSEYIITMLEHALEMLKTMDECSLERLGPLRDTNCPDGCDDINKNNGTHRIDCPRHVNYDKFKTVR